MAEAVEIARCSRRHPGASRRLPYFHHCDVVVPLSLTTIRASSQNGRGGLTNLNLLLNQYGHLTETPGAAILYATT